jgi:hypothetical protein
MKFLTICNGGVVRSVSMALRLKLLGQDAIAASCDFNSPATLQYLGSWADYIILMQPRLFWLLPAEVRDEHRGKIRVMNVGEDVWGDPLHPTLTELTDEAAHRWKRAGWCIDGAEFSLDGTGATASASSGPYS